MEVRTMRRALVINGIGVAAAIVGWKLFDPWQRHWGATRAEATGALPGDELTAGPVEQCTRAIAVVAPPERVWPWLVQMGADRGGFYSYDWLENLFGLHIHNADRIVPDWQQLAAGDMVWANRARTGGWVVELVVPGEAVVMKVADAATGRAVTRSEGVGFEFQWTFALRPTPDGGTRLLIRERTAFGRRSTRLLMTPVGPVSFLMTRKMLDGIRRRAERSHSRPIRSQPLRNRAI
jgi:hypothetical protein